MDSLKIICPNGHLGFGALRVESFELGWRRGSTTSRPTLAATMWTRCRWARTLTNSPEWQRHDLEHMLLAAR